MALPTPPPLVRAMHEAVPGSRFEIIPVAGHSSYFEAHEAFNAVLLDFLSTFQDAV